MKYNYSEIKCYTPLYCMCQQQNDDEDEVLMKPNIKNTSSFVETKDECILEKWCTYEKDS